MKALVVGLGSIGVRHLNNLQTLGVHQLSAFRSRNLSPPGDIPDHVQIFYNYTEALSQKPDIVVIANPTAFHLPYAQKAVEVGCHLYFEKPISHTLDDVEKLKETVTNNQCVVSVGCQLRFHENLEKIKLWLDEGKLGKIFSVSVDMGEYLPDWHPWEDYRQSYSAKEELGGGVVLTLIHELDYLFWLFGKVKKVYAIGGQLTSLKINVEDTAIISQTTESGTFIQLRMDYWRKTPVRTMSIIGEKGEIYWDYYRGEILKSDRKGVTKSFKKSEKWDRNTLFLVTMKDFLNAIETNTRPRTSLQDGIDVLKIATAAKKSIKEGKIIEL
jgi:predicted dehydrogenase